MYRYGDGTPFPLDENFIDTVTAAVEACAAAYVPLADLDERRERHREGQEEGEAELVDLGKLDEAIVGALAAFRPATDRSARPTQRAAAKVQGELKAAVSTTKAAIQAHVAQLEQAARPHQLGDLIRTALAPFFEAHQLPSSTWSRTWDARGAQAVATATATSGRYVATFDVAATSPWNLPVRIDALQPGITLHVSRRKMFGGAKPQPVALDKTVLVLFERAGTATTIVLREHPAKPSPGWRLTEDGGEVVCLAIDAAGEAQSPQEALSADDAAQVVRLGEAIAARLDELRGRRTLRALRVGDHGLDDHPTPRAVIDGILRALTPLVRSIREKSKMAGELVLKRDVGDGRRDELFVPRAALAAKFAPLPAGYRRLFEEMGLSRDGTAPVVDARLESILDEDVDEDEDVADDEPPTA